MTFKRHIKILEYMIAKDAMMPVGQRRFTPDETTAIELMLNIVKSIDLLLDTMDRVSQEE